ncbi:MAG TPA: phosphoribosylformylglycinamidine synthase subunit PurS [Thermodesulfobacteriota bacterium]|nr:phosphoribosylformylglycinamidine synthase subunit PurS [Thermodesulfobacteriota bacterium]
MKEYKVKVEVKLKPVVLDPQGKSVLSALRNLGFSEVEDARIGKLIELTIKDGDSGNVEERVTEMCRKLLSNPVIENFDVKVEEKNV